MIISITGSFGIGKTTLAIAIAKKIGAKVINENFRAIAEAGKDFNKSRGNLGLSQEKLSNLYECCDTWLRDREKIINSRENIVLDRCCFDILQRYISNLFDKERINKLIEHCIKESSAYDVVIVPAICAWSDLSNKNNDGLIRANNSSLQLRDHLMTIGILNSYCSSRVLIIPEYISSVDERVDFILDTI